MRHTHFVRVLLLILLAGCGGESGSSDLPTARINGVSAVQAGETVSLAGSSSAGPATYTWTLVQRPDGSSAVLSGQDTATVSFTADLPGTYRACLTVTVNGTTSTPAEHTVTAFSAGPDIHVDAANAGFSDGSTSNPFPTIQEAVSAAPAGAVIKVAAGTYPEGVTLHPTNSISLLGGYISGGNFIVRNPLVNTVRISPPSSTNGITMGFTGGTGTVSMVTIDGFSISGGLRGIDIRDGANGGLLYAAIRFNSVTGNGGLSEEDRFGGGILLNGAVPSVIGNTIASNSCGKGGGLAVFFLDDTRPVLILSNTVLSNSARSDHGGGIYIGARKGIISRNIILSNAVLQSWGWGGGMIVDGGQYSGYNDTVCLVLSHNVYSGNSAPSMGSGLFIDEGANVRLYNELISKNSSGDSTRNGALYVDGLRANSGAKTILVNCTIADNTGAGSSEGHAILAEGGSEVIARNCIFHNNRSDNTIDFYIDATSLLTVSHSLYQTGSSGNADISASITGDPLFADGTSGDYHLKSEGGRWTGSSWTTDTVHSPAIDAGDPASPWDNEPSPNGSRVNMGVYGNTPEASRSN